MNTRRGYDMYIVHFTMFDVRAFENFHFSLKIDRKWRDPVLKMVEETTLGMPSFAMPLRQSIEIQSYRVVHFLFCVFHYPLLLKWSIGQFIISGNIVNQLWANEYFNIWQRFAHHIPHKVKRE